MKIIPLVLCVCIFVITTIGFFKTKGKIEKVYGACSGVSLFCAILQIAIIY